METATGAEQRLLKTEKGDDVSIVVTEGVRVGEKVVMNPLLYTKANKADDEVAEEGDSASGPGEAAL